MRIGISVYRSTTIIIFVFLAGCQENTVASFSCPVGAHADNWPDNVPGVTIELQAQGCRDAANLRHGWHVAWQAPGVKHHEGYFEHGEYVREWSYYHSNGSLSSRGFFINGKRDDWWDHWNGG